MNCTQVAKNRKHDKQSKKIETKCIEIDGSLCIKSYTNIKSFGSAPLTLTNNELTVTVTVVKYRSFTNGKVEGKFR